MNNYPFAPLPFPQEMARWDEAAATEADICPAWLMQNAARAALDFLIAKLGPLPGQKMLLFMGKGNNGGDAAALATLAKEAGAEVLVVHLHALPVPDDFSGYGSDVGQNPTAFHITKAQKAGVAFYQLAAPFAPFPAPEWEAPDIVIDGLLGTGFKAPVRSEYASLIKRINLFHKLTPVFCSGGCDTRLAAAAAEWPGNGWPGASSFAHESPETATQATNYTIKTADPNISSEALPRLPSPFILALDIPSGVCGCSGKPSPCAVLAHATVTFEAPKPGNILPSARPYIGQLHIAPVGIPLEVRQRYLPSLALLLPDCVGLAPNPYTFEHKNQAGRVLVVGGSKGMSGAPELAALSALRAGAGLVTVACPSGLENQIRAALPDILTLPLGSNLGLNLEPNPDVAANFNDAAVEEITAHLEADRSWGCIIIGPGLGQSASAPALLKAVLEKSSSPLLLDADALNILAANPAWLPLLRPQDVLTPHPGEAARLLGVTNEVVQADRFRALQQLLQLSLASVVLKGPGTLVGNGVRAALNPFIEPNLALAGSGDVLCGILATYLAQGLTPFAAACAAIYLHGMCGHVLAQKYPYRGNLASEIANAIPEAKLALTKVKADWIPGLSVP